MLITSFITAKLVVVVRKGRWKNELFAIAKVFLEQGDPFASGQLQDSKVRWIVSGILLVGIVISNAYKNDNVYKMVLGRKTLYYDTISSLAEANFTIYSRLIDVTFAYMDDEEKWNKSRMNLNNRKLSSSLQYLYNYSVFVEQPHYSLVMIGVPEISALENDRRQSTETVPNLTWLYNVFTVPQDVLVFLVTTLWKFREKKGNNEFNKTKIKELAKKKEERVIITELSKCNKTAFTMPTLDAKILQGHLKKQNVTLNIGIEPLPDGITGITVLGNVPYSFFHRIWGFTESGIAQWWHSYLGSLNHISTETRVVSPASMRGNMLVIFSLWAGGIVLSLLIASMETYKDEYRLIRIAFLNIKGIYLNSLRLLSLKGASNLLQQICFIVGYFFRTYIFYDINTINQRYKHNLQVGSHGKVAKQ